jgi:EpsI family protein
MSNRFVAIIRRGDSGLQSKRPMSLRVALIISALMCTASAIALVAKDRVRTVPGVAAIQLESAFPREFGGWRHVPERALQVVNPQTQAMLDKLYSQILSRVYVDERGYRIMLSVVYGDDQRGGLRAHMPEVCYPAQGFVLRAEGKDSLGTPYGAIQVRRLDTQLGARQEPVTYWFAFGDRVVSGRFEQRLAELRLGLEGKVPHGLLFRVSSIDPNKSDAYRQQDLFVRDLLAAMAVPDRARLIGLAASH